jgi:hypothetical protein
MVPSLAFVAPASAFMVVLSRIELPLRTESAASVFSAALEEPRPGRLFGHVYCEAHTVPMFLSGSRDDTRRAPRCFGLHAALRLQSSARATDFRRAVSAARHTESHRHVLEQDETLGATRGRVLAVHERIS